MLEKRIGDKSALGQMHTKEIGAQLRAAFDIEDKHYFRAVPNAVFSIGPLEEVKRYIGDRTIYERDMVLDTLAEKGGLKPLIQQLQKMDVYIVGPKNHRGLFFLNYKHFFEISSHDNFHMIDGGIDTVVSDILYFSKPGVYLFSCGMSDAVMISKLHGKIPGAFLIDCGSIWDAFLGIGGQREWRAQLYQDPKKWIAWLQQNLV